MPSVLKTPDTGHGDAKGLGLESITTSPLTKTHHPHLLPIPPLISCLQTKVSSPSQVSPKVPSNFLLSAHVQSPQLSLGSGGCHRFSREGEIGIHIKSLVTQTFKRA